MLQPTEGGGRGSAGSAGGAQAFMGEGPHVTALQGERARQSVAEIEGLGLYLPSPCAFYSLRVPPANFQKYLRHPLQTPSASFPP